MAEKELNQYAILELKKPSEIQESVYNVPKNELNDRRPSSSNTTSDQERTQILQLNSKLKDSSNKLMGTCSILLFAINVLILCLIVLLLTYSRQEDCISTAESSQIASFLDTESSLNTTTHAELIEMIQNINNIVNINQQKMTGNITEISQNFKYLLSENSIQLLDIKTAVNQISEMILNTNDIFKSAITEINTTLNDVQSNVDILQSMKVTTAQTQASVEDTQTMVSSVKANVEHTNTTLTLISTAVDQTKGIVGITSNNISNLLRIPKSCQDVRTVFPSSTSGYYYINNEEVVYCKMGELCGIDGGWSRLAYLDMTDNNTVNCPSGLRYYSLDGVEACGRPVSTVGSCGSVTFPSHGISYSEVCGRVVGYQYGSPDGIKGSDINSNYNDGVSITSGNPRTHVWTLMGEVYQTKACCQCSSQYSGKSIPSFIGNDYFCESGNPNPIGTWSPTLYKSDPLWDGEGCSSYESGCCSGPPWFHKTINTTTDYLEMRICSDQETNNEDTPVSVYEIYVK